MLWLFLPAAKHATADSLFVSFRFVSSPSLSILICCCCCYQYVIMLSCCCCCNPLGTSLGASVDRRSRRSFIGFYRIPFRLKRLTSKKTLATKKSKTEKADANKECVKQDAARRRGGGGRGGARGGGWSWCSQVLNTHTQWQHTVSCFEA